MFGIEKHVLKLINLMLHAYHLSCNGAHITDNVGQNRDIKVFMNSGENAHSV